MPPKLREMLERRGVREPALFVEAFFGMRDQHLGGGQHRHRVVEGDLPQLHLRPGRADHAGGGADDSHRLAAERRFPRRPRQPVEGVLEAARHRVVVFGRRDEDGIRRFDLVAQRRYRCRPTGGLYIGIVDRQVERPGEGDRQPRRRQLLRRAQRGRVIGEAPQAAGNGEDSERLG
jgi:hypothetical protein